MASSPVVGTFSTSKDAHVKSPAPSLMQRIPSSRGRQNSAQSLVQEARNRPSSSTSNKVTAGNDIQGSTADVEKIIGPIDGGINNIKKSMKEVVNTNGEHTLEEDRKGNDDVREALAIGDRGVDRLTKKEELDTTVSQSRQDRPRSISISTRGNGKISKTSTPTQGSFTEIQRMRPMRGVDPGKRSHKKGAGLAAQIAAAVQGGDDDDEKNGEPRYCYCNQISYGEMVACDMENCPREWFHLDCLGLNKAPKGAGKSPYPPRHTSSSSNAD